MVDKGDYAERLQQAMSDAKITVSALGSKLGLSYQAVKKVLDRKSNSFTAANNAAAAKILGVSSDWLASGTGTKRPTVLLDFFTGKHGPISQLSHPEDTTKQSVAQILSLDESTVPAPTPWEILMRTPELPQTYAALMPDDAIDEVVMRGTYLTFDRALKPRPGDKVMVRCLGQLHIRLYEQAVDGWVGRATRKGYASFSSADTELVAVVSMTGRNPD
jgi:transcriptional regulator with XRE-family HTH domain